MRYDRPTPRRGGGVAILLRKNLKFHLVAAPLNYSHIELLCIDIDHYDTPCRIICYYRPPGLSNLDVEYIDCTVRYFQHLCSTDRTVVITGDFNLPDVDWDYYHGPDNFIYNSVLQFINSYGFTQYVNSGTRGSNVLDLLLADSSCLISNVNILPPIGTSDHSTVLFKMNLSVSTVDSNKEKQVYRHYTRADYDGLNSYLLSVNWNGIFQHCFDIDNCWSAFLHVIDDAVQMFVPTVQIKKKLAVNVLSITRATLDS